MEEITLTEGCKLQYCVKCGTLFFDRDEFLSHESLCDGTPQDGAHVVVPDDEAEQILAETFHVVQGEMVPVPEWQTQTYWTENNVPENISLNCDQMSELSENEKVSQGEDSETNHSGTEMKKIVSRKKVTRSGLQIQPPARRARVKSLPSFGRKAAKTVYVEMVVPDERSAVAFVDPGQSQQGVEIPSQSFEDTRTIRVVEIENDENFSTNEGFMCSTSTDTGDVMEDIDVIESEVYTFGEGINQSNDTEEIMLTSSLSVGDENKEKKIKRSSKHRSDTPEVCEYHITIEDDKEMIKCNYCTYKTRYIHMFGRHITTHNDGGKPFICDICSFQCLFRGIFQAHRKKHARPFTCDVCSYKCSNARDLKRHAMRHEGVMPFSCETCGKQFRQKIGFEIHKRVHSGDLFRCEIEDCNYATANPQTLKAHKQRKHKLNIEGMDNYLCDCGYSTRDKSAFSIHRKSHLGLKDYRCPYCDYTAIKKCEVKRHMKKHSRSKFYHCNQCEFETSHETSLRHHLMSHENMKPYSCSICSFNSISRTNIQYHMESMHPGEPISILFDGYRLKVDLKTFGKHESDSFEDNVVKITYGTREREAITLENEEVSHVSVVKELIVENFEDEIGVGTYQCERCRFKCYSASSLASHEIEAHEESTGEREVILDGDLVSALVSVQAQMDVVTS